jgi:short-subunit dehydrogenase
MAEDQSGVPEYPADFITSLKKYGPWAVIAGGSEGVGLNYARRLARAGINLVLIARKPGPLEDSAQMLRTATGIQVRTLSVDLTAPDLLDGVRKLTDDVDVGLLIYNAGGPIALGPFIKQTFREAMYPLYLCSVNLTALTHHYAVKMAERGRGGGLLFTGSGAGFAGLPNISTYAGAKAHVHMLAEALWIELRPLGIDVVCYSLGLTETPAKVRAMGAGAPPGVPLADPDVVAHQALVDLISNNGPIQVPPGEFARMQHLYSLPRNKLLEAEASYVDTSSAKANAEV